MQVILTIVVIIIIIIIITQVLLYLNLYRYTNFLVRNVSVNDDGSKNFILII